MKLRPLDEQVMVVTGASSGIGRATALLAAKRGAAVVCAARGQAGLDTLVTEIERSGGQAMAGCCDVTDAAAVDRLADAAIARFGRIDTWVNNAGVAIAALLEDLPVADARRLFDVNFWGIVNGCRAALPHLRERGGALINLGSFVSDVASPYMGIYAASKHAVRGYTDALRIELKMDDAPVSVTLIRPGPIATPVLEHQLNRLDRRATMPPPFYRPEDAAAAICYAAEHPARDLFVGSSARVGSVVGWLFPKITDFFTARLAPQLFRTSAPPSPRPNNLWHSSKSASVGGDTHGRVARRSIYTALRLRPRAVALTLMVAGTVMTGAATVRKSMARSRC